MKRRDFIGGSLASVAVARSSPPSVPESTGSNESVEFDLVVLAKVVKPEAHSPGRVDLVVQTVDLIPSNVITLRIDGDGERDTYGKYSSTQGAWLFAIPLDLSPASFSLSVWVNRTHRAKDVTNDADSIAIQGDEPFRLKVRMPKAQLFFAHG